MNNLIKRFYAVLLTGLLTGLVAACGGDDEPQSFDAGTLGAVEVGQGEAIQIRSMLALSGGVPADITDWAWYSINQAIEDFGTIHGHAVDPGAEPIDTKCTQEGGRTGAWKVIDDPQVLGVIGTTCSDAAKAASPLLSAAGRVMISPSATGPSLTSELPGTAAPNYYPGFFRTAQSDSLLAQTVAEFASNQLGLKRVVTLDTGDTYTMGFTTAFAKVFEFLGGEVALAETIARDQTEMREVLERFAGANPDGIFFPLYKEQGPPFVEQLRDYEGLEGVVMIAGDAFFTAEFLAKPESEGIYFASTVLSDAGFNEATGRTAEDIISEIESSYGVTGPQVYWQETYDATTLLLSAIEAAAIQSGGMLFIDRAGLREGIGSTEYSGLIGMLSCGEFGDCGAMGTERIYHHNDLSVTDPSQVMQVYPSES